MISASIKAKFAEIVGEKYLTDEPVELYCYSHDYTSRALSWVKNLYDFKPDLIVKPINEDQIQKIIEIANDENLKLIPRGAGTSFGGQFLPIEGGIILDLTRMNQILEINTEDNYAVVQPGVLYKDLGNLLRETGKGYWIPCNPGSADICTIGGMIANDASGEAAIKYGTTRDYILNLKIILGYGKKIQLGNMVKKTVSGLDLLSLFIGSEGTLGIVTEATIQFLPLPESFLTIIGYFNSIESAIIAAKEVKEFMIPMSIELVDQTVLNGMKTFLARRSSKLEMKSTKAVLLIRLDGEEDIIEKQANKIAEMIRNSESSEGFKILSGVQHEDLWKARDGAGPALASILPPPKNPSTFSPSILDFSVPFSKIPELMDKMTEVLNRNNINFGRLGHLGDGNVHLISSFPMRSEDDLVSMGKIQEELVEITISLGGSVTAEHGCGIWKVPYLGLEHGEETFKLMKEIKHIFDPNNVLNPGKLYVVQKLANFLDMSKGGR